MLVTSTEAGARAEARLREELIIWLTTVRSDGQPQSVPVWFLWHGETFLIYSQPGRHKLENIGSNPRVGLHLNSSANGANGGDVVRIEGTAEVVQDFPPADEYAEKYRERITRMGLDPDGFARAYSVALWVEPDRWRVW
jgi:PPOX class probable F420-dependent enzyme